MKSYIEWTRKKNSEIATYSFKKTQVTIFMKRGSANTSTKFSGEKNISKTVDYGAHT